MGPGSKEPRALLEDILAANKEVLDTSNPSHLDNTLPDPDATPAPPAKVTSPEKPKLKVGLFVGHNKGTGAVAIDGADEWESRNKVALAASEKLTDAGYEVHVIYRDGSVGYSAAMRAHGERSRADKLDVAIELHFNAYDGQAHGAEMIVATHKSANTLGKAFQEATEEFYPNRTLRDGGVKLKTSGRGHLFNANQRCPSGIYEPCFGDAEEWLEYAGDVDKEASYLANIVERFHEGAG